jgi:hypothetical protein
MSFGWFTFRLWWLFAATAAVALAMAYFGSYYRITRVNVHYDPPITFYVPPDRIFQDDWDASEEAYYEHVRWMIFYEPAHWLDENVFGGPPVYRGGVRRLTK